jgi:hypothetical protein
LLASRASLSPARKSRNAVGYVVTLGLDARRVEQSSKVKSWANTPVYTHAEREAKNLYFSKGLISDFSRVFPYSQAASQNVADLSWQARRAAGGRAAPSPDRPSQLRRPDYQSVLTDHSNGLQMLTAARGTSRHFVARRQFDRFRSKADICRRP